MHRIVSLLLATIVCGSAANVSLGQRFRWDPNFGAGGLNGDVYAITSHDGDLYVGGDFTLAGTTSLPVRSLARWDGTQWHDVGGGVRHSATGLSEGKVFALASFGGKLWVGGQFRGVGVGTAVDGFASWNGSSWSSEGTGIPVVTERVVQALHVAGSTLYAGAWWVTEDDETTGVFELSSGSWSSCGLLLGQHPGVFSIADGPEFGLLAGGQFLGAADTVRNAVVINSCFDALPDIDTCGTVSGPTMPGYAIAEYQERVYLGGRYRCGDSVECCQAGLMSTDGGGDWTEHHDTSQQELTDVLSLLVFQEASGVGDLLYVGGKPSLEMYAVDPVTGVVNGIGKFDGSEWFGLCTGIPGSVFAMAEHEGDLFVGGDFQQAGGHSVDNVARWYFEPCIADWDGSGTVDFFDSLAFQNDLAAENPVADLDCDGEATFIDYLEFQDLYGDGC